MARFGKLFSRVSMVALVGALAFGTSPALASTQTGDGGGSVQCWTQSSMWPDEQVRTAWWLFPATEEYIDTTWRPDSWSVCAAPPSGGGVACTTIDAIYYRYRIDDSGQAWVFAAGGSTTACNNGQTVYFPQ